MINKFRCSSGTATKNNKRENSFKSKLKSGTWLCQKYIRNQRPQSA